jgi:hypothetical protein
VRPRNREGTGGQRSLSRVIAVPGATPLIIGVCQPLTKASSGPLVTSPGGSLKRAFACQTSLPASA